MVSRTFSHLVERVRRVERPRRQSAGHLHRRLDRKAVELTRWMVHQRVRTPRPRIQGRPSSTFRRNARWAMDVTHISCGVDGWGHLTAVINCHDGEIIGYEFAAAGPS